jgi:hypothetical protein
MKLCKENGFDFNARIRLDDESIKALYPEFLLTTDYKNISPTYLKWKKENEETGITQRDFLENISCHYLTYNGKTQTIREWAKETGIKENTLICRLKYGWTVERALSEKLHF